MNDTSKDNAKPEHPFFKALDHVEAGVCFVSIFGMTFVICLHVVFRYVLMSPLQWSEEVSRMMSIWAAYGGASYAFRRGAHIGVTALVDRLPRRAGRFVKLSGDLLVIVFFLVVLFYGSWLAYSMIGITSVAARIPMVIPYSALPIGSAMVLIRLVQMFYYELKGEKPCGGDAV
ncbi:TRAP transporter small permease [Deltaproteobacteria bacterium OttesenSCG-928-M10]|nr:TRAP transporter small permease [Deltaproteobacteria bacterium OttesenSCG-928-M10]